MPSIDERIAELEQRIAEKRAYQRLYPSHKYASTWDYVAEGDRSGFDKMDASEAAYLNMIAQQDFNAKQNELNRKNAMALASMNKDSQAAYDKQRLINSKELELDLLKAKREEVARVGGNTKEYDLKINSIYKQFPELGTAVDVETSWDPTKSQSYLLASYSDYDDSYTQDELNDAIANLNRYAETDEGAKRLAQLNKSLKKRQKYDSNAAQIKADLDKYAQTGELSDLLVELGWTVEGSVNNRYAQRNGKGNKTFFKGKGKKSKPVLK